MAADKGMSETQLTALVDRHISDALDFDSSLLKYKRELELQFINGDVDIPSEEGKSKVVSHDMADTLNAVIPGLLKVFLSTDRVVVYEPRRPDFQIQKKKDLMTGMVMPMRVDLSKERADQCTDYVNYVFLSDCSGYQVLYNAMYSGLAHGNGIIKHWWDDAPEYVTETRRGLSEEAFIKLVGDEDVEVIEHTAYPDASFTFASAEPNPALIAATAPPGAPPATAGAGTQAPPVQPAGLAGSGAGLPGVLELPAMGGSVGQTQGDGQPPGDQGAVLAGGQHGIGAAATGDALAPPEPFLQPMLHDVRIRRVISHGRLMIKAVPDEEFMISRMATALTERDCGGFVGHSYRETRSELIKQGYDPERVMELSASQQKWDIEKQVREELVDMINPPTDNDETLELVDVFECYVLCDYNGDGVAEWRQVIMAGGTGNRNILANEEWDGDLPFTDLVPEPVPYRWRGRSIGDDTIDIQRIKTTLLRQMLNNLYATNNPQKLVSKNAVDPPFMDALVNQELGAVIVANSLDAVRTLDVPFTAKESYSMLEYFDGVTMKRTGVNQQDKSLDANTLQNVSATAANIAQTAAHAKVETYARNISENGLKRLFGCLLKLIYNNQDRSRTIRLRGEWVEMDPRQWDPDMDVTINTGLGSGSRERDLGALMGVLQEQKQIAQSLGPTNPIAGVDQILNTLRKMAECAGLKGVEQYFGEPTPEFKQQLGAPKPPQPDPKEMAKAQVEQQKMQMQAQAEAAKMQAQMQFEQQKARMEFAMKQKDAEFNQQMEAARANRDAQAQQANLEKQAQVEQMQAQADIEVKRRDADMKWQFEQRKFEQQMALEQQKFEFEKQLKLMDHQMKAAAMQPPMPSVDAVVVAP